MEGSERAICEARRRAGVGRRAGLGQPRRRLICFLGLAVGVEDMLS